MPHTIEKAHGNVIVKAIKTLIHKMVQSPDVYPIKFYMKSSRFRRNYSFK
jgi:hypothetical protein